MFRSFAPTSPSRREWIKLLDDVRYDDATPTTVMMMHNAHRQITHCGDSVNLIL